ncbi:hypothetical protein, conserved [Eimeria tenella]|uniref:Uncharacterized protein n=1 Tax=Eimeria tenella TaxID=5802 RepID=U6L2F7_EIMTE|nr:hypothetical protein, conserved [Eimeria tenella]CDJ41930.1 hypothetical protein, conserved [Eimeria tenella]|eukprot:XP_013232680.1 hypothetical protein, conserved [Eimeria tenella]
MRATHQLKPKRLTSPTQPQINKSPTSNKPPSDSDSPLNMHTQALSAEPASDCPPTPAPARILRIPNSEPFSTVRPCFLQPHTYCTCDPTDYADTRKAPQTGRLYSKTYAPLLRHKHSFSFARIRAHLPTKHDTITLRNSEGLPRNSNVKAARKLRHSTSLAKCAPLTG